MGYDQVMELGVRTPASVEKARLGTGEVGYMVSGVRNVLDARVGDTITLAKDRELPLSVFVTGCRLPHHVCLYLCAYDIDDTR